MDAIIARSNVADVCAEQGPEAVASHCCPDLVIAADVWIDYEVPRLRGLSLTDLNDYRYWTSARYVRDPPCAPYVNRPRYVFFAAETTGATEETYNEPVHTTILFARYYSI